MTLNNENKFNKTNLIIIDVDGGYDDAWAIATLILSSIKNNFSKNILGITCVNGNTTIDNVLINVNRVLTSLDYNNIPIYKGCSEPIVQLSLRNNNKLEDKCNSIMGNDGFCDIYKTKPSIINSENEHAVNALNRIVNIEHPEQVTLFCLGPLTNIAMTLKMFPNFGNNIKEVYIMGGNYKATGNVTKTAEYNFHADPEAAFIVLQKIKSPIIMVPWEACSPNNFNISWDWRINKLGNLDDKFINLINPVETELFKRFNNNTVWLPCDLICILVFILGNKLIKKSNFQNATVELHGLNTRGQVVIDHLNNEPINILIIEEIYENIFKDYLLSLFQRIY